MTKGGIGKENFGGTREGQVSTGDMDVILQLNLLTRDDSYLS